MDALPLAAQLFAVLDELRSRGRGLDLDRSAGRFVVVGLRAEGVLATWLTLTAIGRHTGHAPAACDVCGELSMVAVVASSGTRRGRKSAPWPKCRICQEGSRVIREADFEGVARRKPPSIPRS